MKNNDKHEILDAISLIADQMQEMRNDMMILRNDMTTGFVDVRSDLNDLKKRVTKIEATMVTKDYLDDKLADVHSDVVKYVKRRVPCWTEV